MRETVRAIIIENGEIILIRRVKNGETFFVFPGGGIEEGETHAQALIRECHEELGLAVEVGKLFFADEFAGARHHFYSCKIRGGTLGTGQGAEFQPGYAEGGTREAVKISLAESAESDVRPLAVRDKISSEFE